jgi:DnaB helicase-like protein/primase-like protein
MLYPEYKYVGYKNTLRDYTKIYELGHLPIDLELPKDGEESYQSIYRFDEGVTQHEHLADLDERLLFYSDFLVFDFDSTDLNISLVDTQHFDQLLQKIGAQRRVYFSGNKGFHVLVPTCQFGYEPTSDEGILKRMATLLASRYQSFDPSIYNKTRIFRLPNSLNLKSGLFKTPLRDVQSLSISDVTQQAKEPADWDFGPAYDYPKVELLVRLYQDAKPKVNRFVTPSEPLQGNGRILRDAPEGKRNDTLYKICRAFARRAIMEPDMSLIAHSWNSKQAKPLSAEEVDQVVRSAYKKGVNSIVEDESIFSQFYTPRKALAEMRSLYTNWAGNVFFTGYDFIDEYTMGFMRQEVIFILARSGNFKTALLSNILHGIARTSKKPVLFFSMEMGKDQLTQRHIQKAEHLSQKEVMDGLKAGREFYKYETDFNLVHTVHVSSLDTDRVLALLDKYMEEYGEIAAIGFDYLSLFKGCANNTERTATMATELKTRIAKAANCPTFCLVQAKREYEGDEGDIEIDKTAGKDSSSIEDSGDYLMGAWGYWQDNPVIDDVTGEKRGTNRIKRLFGGFLKSRKFLYEKYPLNPYFEVEIDRPYMDVTGIKYAPYPPTFNQKKEY